MWIEILRFTKKIFIINGYNGEPGVISIHNEFDSTELANFKDHVLACHESFNSSLKAYKVHSTRFYHDVANNKIVFELSVLLFCTTWKMATSHCLILILTVRHNHSSYKLDLNLYVCMCRVKTIILTVDYSYSSYELDGKLCLYV